MSSSAKNYPVSAELLQQRALLDRSVKYPFLFFILSGMVWLLLACVMSFIATIKLWNPMFMVDWAVTNWGRLHPASINALVYGWGFQAAIAVALWIMARICRCPLSSGNALSMIVAGHVWNLGVTIGVVGILLGRQAPGELLEFGHTSWLLLFGAYTAIIVSIIVKFAVRPEGADFISQQYVVAAGFAFPWLYLTAKVFASSGVGLHAVIATAWYSNSLIYLFFVPIALAAAYYLIPKIVDRPIASYHLAQAGFWSLMIFGGWTGINKLLGTPISPFLPAISAAAHWLVLIPVICVAVNHYMTVRGRHKMVQVSPTLRFLFAGGWGFVACGVAGAVIAADLGTHQFTLSLDGWQFVGVYSCFTMMMFGAVYFIMPRLTGCEWDSAKFIRFHFWFNVYGGLAVAACYFLAGFAQSITLNSWDGLSTGLTENPRPWHIGRTIGWFFVTIANVSFFFHLLWIALRLSRRSEYATMLGHGPDDDDHSMEVTTPEAVKA